MSDTSDDNDSFPTFKSAPKTTSERALITSTDPTSDSKKRHRHDKHDRHPRSNKEGRISKDRKGPRHDRSKSPRVHRRRHSRRQRIEASDAPDRSAETYSILRQALADGLLLVDKRGNRDLLIYKHGLRLGAPEFKRSGVARRVLGVDNGYLFVENGNASNPESGRGPLDILLVARGDDHISHTRYTDVEWNTEAPAEKVALGVADNDVYGTRFGNFDDYVPLVTTGDHNSLLHTESNALSLYDDVRRGTESVVDYRSLDGMAKPAPEHQSSSLDFVRNDLEKNDRMRKTNLDFEQQLKERPDDVDAWIKYIDFQKEMPTIPATGNPSSLASFRYKRAVAEIQIEMYRKAIDHNPNSSALVVRYLQCIENIFDSTEVLDEWKKIIDDRNGLGRSPEILLEYIRFRQSLASIYTIWSIVSIYEDTVRIFEADMKQIQDDETLSAPRSNEKYADLSTRFIDVIHQLALMFRESGYTEHAISIYQAIIEWYVFCPQRLREGLYTERLQEFERFWDSGVPRIGMAGASGWCSFYRGKTSEQGPEIIEKEEDSPSADTKHKDEPKDNVSLTNSSKDELYNWYEKEVSETRKNESEMPTTIKDMSVVDELTDKVDPFSLIVFEDVKCVLIDIKWDNRIAELLIERMLKFFGLISPQVTLFQQREETPVSNINDLFNWAAPGDPIKLFTRDEDLKSWQNQEADTRNEKKRAGEWIDGIFVATSNLSHSWSASDIAEYCRFPLVSVPTLSQTVGTVAVPSRLINVLMSGRVPPCYYYSAEYSLELLCKAKALNLQSHLSLCMMLSSMALERSYEHGIEVTKRVLENDPSCMLLWNCLAQHHARNHKYDLARNIWYRALVTLKKMPPNTHKMQSDIILCAAWMAFELDRGLGPNAALLIILALAYEVEGLNIESLEAIISKDKPRLNCASNPSSIIRTRSTLKLIRERLDDCEFHIPLEAIAAVNSIILWGTYLINSATNQTTTEMTLTATASEIINTPCVIEEVAAMSICDIYVYNTRMNRMYTPRHFRSHLQRSLKKFPHNTLFWELFIYSERFNRINNRVQNQMSTIVSQSGETPDLCFIRIYIELNVLRQSGGYGNLQRARETFRNSANGFGGRDNFSVIFWMAYLIFEHSNGSMKRARRVFYKALRACPWARQIYLLAFGLLDQAFTYTEKREIIRTLVSAELRLHSSSDVLRLL